MATHASTQFTHEAGVYEQADGGWRTVTRSRHRTQEAAERAALRLLRGLWRSGQSVGGSYSWSAWWGAIGGETVEVTRIPREEV